MTSVVIAALLSVPAIATSYEQYDRRNVAESDLYGRDFFSNDDILAVREDLEEFFGRELVDDLEERGGGIGALLSIAKGLRRAKSVTGGSGGSNNDNNNSNNNNNNGGHRRHHWFGRGLDAELDLRDFDEDLEVREPADLEALAKGIHALHKAHKAARTASQFIPQGGNGDNQRRDLDDEEVFVREPVDLEAVAKGIHALHKAHKAVSTASQFVPQGGNGDNQRRGWDDEEMFEREPVDLEAVAKGIHALHKAHRAAQTASQFVPQGGDNGNNQRRDLYDEEMFERDFDEFLTREYYDDLD